MRRATTKVLVVFGILNLAFGSFGVYLMLTTAWMMRGRLDKPPYGAPYTPELFWSLALVQLLFSFGLIASGVQLLRLRRSGVVISIGLFASELVYFVVGTVILVFVFPLGDPLHKSILSAQALTDIPLAPQLFTAYPLIGLIAMLLIMRRTPPEAWA